MPETEFTSNAAIAAALAQDWKKAIRINTGILIQNKEDINALNRLGFAYLQHGQFAPAKKTFQKVLNLDPYNQIASRNLKKLTTLKHKDIQRSEQQLSPLLFLEDPGKTKIASCVNLAPVQMLCGLYAGQEVQLKAKNHCVEIRDAKNVYLGALPDDLSFKLIKFIGGGNRYQVIIKGVSKNSLTVFLREISRGKRFLNHPSFITASNSFFLNRPKSEDITPSSGETEEEGNAGSEEV